MSEKNNPIEGILDLIKQYTNEDISKIDSAKNKLSSLLNSDSLKGLLDSQKNGPLGALENLEQVADMMNVLPMVEKVVNQRMNYKQKDCDKKDNHQNGRKDIEKLLEEILDELKYIKKCTCYKKHHCYKENWEHWY